MSNGEVVKSKKNGTGNGATVDSSREGSECVSPPPDGGWGWVVVFASCMIHIVTDGMTYGAFGVFYSEFLNYFEEGTANTAWIVSILVGVTLGSGPISGSFVNRWGCQAVTVAGALMTSVCLIISSLATNVLTLIFTLGVGAGFGFGLIYLPAIVSVTVWFKKYRSLATGIAVCGAGIGTFLFAPITEALIKNYGWRGAMAIFGAFMLNCVPLGIMFRPVPEAPRTPTRAPMLPQPKKTQLQRSQSTEQMVRANGTTDDKDIARLTLSQPALNKPNEQKKIHSRHGSGVMQRPDVLYQGSIASLVKVRSPSPERVYTVKDEDEVKDTCSWLPCAAESKAALLEMLDLSLLVDPVFVLFAVSNFLTSIGYYIPYIYIVPLCKSLNIDNSAYILSIIGVSNLIGRIILGFISDKTWVNRLLAYNLCLTVAGVGTALVTGCWEFWGIAVCATIFGFTTGAYVGLTSVVLVDLIGLQRLTNAFGILLLFQGIASLVGPPFVGMFYDRYHSYAPAFYVAGVTLSLSGLVLFFIPLLVRRQASRWAEGTALEQI